MRPPPAKAAQASSRQSAGQCLFICLLLAFGTAFLYAPARHFDFVTYDDPVYVINNFHVNGGLNGPAFKWAFNVGYASNWHPVTWLSHAMDCQWFGMQPGPMHFTNIVLHTLNSLLLFLLLRAMTGKTYRSSFVAALFAWHPMHVESVAWISERKDVLSALFFLLTIWAYWRYTRDKNAHPRKALAFYLAALALFALGLMAKPMLVTLPFVLLLLDFWPLGRITPDKNMAMRLRSLCLEKIPFCVLSAGSCVLTLVAQARGEAVQSLAWLPPGIRILNALIGYQQYMAKLLWPRGLSVVYPYDTNLAPMSGVWPAFLIVVGCAGGVLLWRRRGYVLSGWLWFLGTLVPVIGLVQVGGQAMADRYSYLPSIGFFIVVCWGVADMVEDRLIARVAAATVGIAALGGCLFLGRDQVSCWRNTGALFQRAIAVDSNNFIAHADYASYLLILQNWKGAETECETALRLNPDYAPAHDCLGFALFKQGRYAQAAAELRLTLQTDPHKYDACLQLGNVLLAQGMPEDAIQQFRTYLKHDQSDAALAHFGLGKALAAEGKWEEACPEYTAALELPVAFPEAHAELALALSKTGHIAEAIDEYDATLHFNTNHLEALNNLAWILAANPNPKLRNAAQAVTLAQRACALTTNGQPLFIGTLAAAFAEAGRFADAVATAQQAHDVALAQSNSAVAARNLQLMELYRAHQAYHEP